MSSLNYTEFIIRYYIVILGHSVHLFYTKHNLKDPIIFFQLKALESKMLCNCQWQNILKSNYSFNNIVIFWLLYLRGCF